MKRFTASGPPKDPFGHLEIFAQVARLATQEFCLIKAKLCSWSAFFSLTSEASYLPPPKKKNKKNKK